MEATTIRISNLSITDVIEDSIIINRCDVTDLTCVVVGATPLDPNDYKSARSPLTLAIHAGDTWITGVVAQVTGLSHTIDKIVEEYYDRVEWMLSIMSS